MIFRSVISIFLFLNYSFAFAIELVPHCHIDNQANHIETTHEDHHHHHQHVTVEDDDDIYHQNHLDDNLLDFVICVLSEIDHFESDSFHSHMVQSQTRVRPNVSFQIKVFVSVSEIVTEPDANRNQIRQSKEISNDYLVDIVSSSPRRGPPRIS